MTTILERRRTGGHAPTRGNGVLLATILFGQFMAILDVSIVNVAVPTIHLDLPPSGRRGRAGGGWRAGRRRPRGYRLASVLPRERADRRGADPRGPPAAPRRPGRAGARVRPRRRRHARGGRAAVRGTAGPRPRGALAGVGLGEPGRLGAAVRPLRARRAA